MGENICCSSKSKHLLQCVSALPHRDNGGKSLNSPSYLYQREIQPGELVSLECSDFEEHHENSGKQDEEEDGMLECDSPRDDGDTPSLEREADFYLGGGSRFERSIRFTLILTCLYEYFSPRSKLNGRKSLTLLTYDNRVKLLKWTISSFWWKQTNLRLTVTVDFNGSTLVEKIIAYRIGPLTLNGLKQHFMIGIGISRYKPSGLRDWKKILVGIAGLKNPVGDPLSKLTLSKTTNPCKINYLSWKP